MLGSFICGKVALDQITGPLRAKSKIVEPTSALFMVGSYALLSHCPYVRLYVTGQKIRVDN